ncbi:MAG: hypothetical protein IKV57_02990 [Clostridia bacterium]|nr:hypothetical protein [Clostridia bacterium]
MKRNVLHRSVRFLLFVLMAALALCFVSCGGNDKAPGEVVTFTLTVVGPDGTPVDHEVTSGAANLGDALLTEGLIEAEKGPYGLYINTVTGITADFDNNGAYWSLYIGDEYAMTGISDTPITNGAVYKLVYEVYAG